jgi:hypothetical protein
MIKLIADYSITLTRLLLKFGSIDDENIAAHVTNGAGSLQLEGGASHSRPRDA